MNRHSQRGMMLVPVTFMVLFMAGLAVAFLTEVQAEKRSIAQHEHNLYALQTAETGLIQAELEIRSLIDSGTDGVGTVSGTLHLGSYEVTAVKSALSDDRWILTALGERDMSRRRIEVGLRRRQVAAFVEGMFSKDELNLNGNSSIDSFDSRNGTYASQAVNVDAEGPYANRKGHIGSNENIVFSGTSNAVRGNAIPGVLNEVLQSGSPIITGDTLPRTAEVPVPDPTAEEFVAAYNTNNNLNITGVGQASGNSKKGYNTTDMSLNVANTEVATLPAGTYFFSDVAIKGKMVITGDVTIYATGSFDSAGQGITNTPGTAGNLTIVAHPYALPTGHVPSTSEVKLTGGSEFIGTVYAPGVPITLGGSTEFFGAIVGSSITNIGDLHFHYDEALGASGGRSEVLVERIYWRELSRPAR